MIYRVVCSDINANETVDEPVGHSVEETSRESPPSASETASTASTSSTTGILAS